MLISIPPRPPPSPPPPRPPPPRPLHPSGLPLGGHAVKMIGWGVEDSVPYWICVNSWNNLWGEGGTFRILRGKNECAIETECVAGEV